MKFFVLVLCLLGIVTLAAFPPKIGRSQKDSQPVIRLAEPLDTSGLPVSTVKLIDSLDARDLRIKAKTDSLIILARQIERDRKPKRYAITEYEAPIAVVSIPFENKTILAQYDPKRKIFLEREVIIK
jgi:hypothetical protein